MGFLIIESYQKKWDYNYLNLDVFTKKFMTKKLQN